MTFFDYRTITNATQAKNLSEEEMWDFKYNKMLDGFADTIGFILMAYAEMTDPAQTLENIMDHVAYKGILVGALVKIRDAEMENEINKEVSEFAETLKSVPEIDEK